MISEKLNDSVTSSLITSLTMLQHRGQNGCGIAVSDNDRITYKKQQGLISTVFNNDTISRINGYYGIGQCHNNFFYNSLGSEPQPAYCNMPFGLSVVMSGSVNNRDALRKEFAKHLRLINSYDDADYIVNVFSEALIDALQGAELNEEGIPIPTKEHIFAAAHQVFTRCHGGYACVILINGVGLVAFRDPHGIRPLIYGEQHVNNEIQGFCVSSESISISSLDYEVKRDLKCAETLFIDKNMNIYLDEDRSFAKQFTPCIYEYAFYALPNSIIDGISVYDAREAMGRELAESIRHTYIDYEGEKRCLADVITHIMPIPETSRHTAVALSHALQIPYCEGISKNRYIARTFLMPGQVSRIEAMKIKHSPIRVALEGENILLVDDSMIRGTTATIVIDTIRKSGAKNVFIATACPPVKYKSLYGLNLPDSKDYVSHEKSDEEIRNQVGADYVVFQSVDGLVNACKSCHSTSDVVIERFETSVFDGKYVTDEDN